jgi:hypothetical protein
MCGLGHIKTELISKRRGKVGELKLVLHLGNLLCRPTQLHFTCDE